MMTKFELAKGGKLIGKVSEYRAKKLETKNTAFKLDVVTAKGKDGKMHECFILTNKKGVATPLLKSISIDLEHYLGATTKKCLCETLPTKDQKLGYIYVDLQTGNVSEAFDVVGRGHDHKNDYAIGEDKTIKIVNDDLTLTDSEYVYVGRPTSSDLKSYTRDAGFVVRHIPTGEYGVVSTFGRTDGAIKVLCPPVFDDPKIGHRTISTEKYNFLYEYFIKNDVILFNFSGKFIFVYLTIYDNINVMIDNIIPVLLYNKRYIMILNIVKYKNDDFFDLEEVNTSVGYWIVANLENAFNTWNDKMADCSNIVQDNI